MSLVSLVSRLSWRVRLTQRALTSLTCLMSLTCLTIPTPLLAQRPVSAFNTRAFEPTIDTQGLVTTERAVGLNTGEFNLSLGVDFAFNPLKQRFSVEGASRSYTLIERYTSAQLSMAVGLWGHVTLGLSQPLLILKGDLDGPGAGLPFSTDGAGDTRLSLKVTALDSEAWPVGVAFALNAHLALAHTHPLTTEGLTPLLTPWLIIDSGWRYVTLSANVGYVMRAEGALNSVALLAPVEEGGAPTPLTPLDPITLGPELAYRAGVEVRYVPEVLHQSFEALGASPVGSAQRGERLEALTALRLIFNRGSHLTLGASRGLLEGYASPDLRLFMAITFQPIDPDSDGDGLPDSQDRCPRDAEDQDGFEDSDGCPEPDNDLDGLPDLFDQCPLRPEDKNGFEDDDGCPDNERDLDRDGVPDTLDECKLEPEDQDGFADQDGCPDNDNDRDGIPDAQDRCPNDSEDFDAHEDDDGCPDTDNDGDGIKDVNDECPHVPEDKDGVEDSDGCPDDDRPQPSVSIRKGLLDVRGVVYFETSKANIRPESHQLLFEVAITLNNHPELLEIEVQGHTDARGRSEVNMALSEARAAEVRRFLIEEGSVEASRLTSKGYGSTRPLIAEDTPQAYAKNRRVIFEIKRTDTP